MEHVLDPFREETRAWLEANCPPAMRQPLLSEGEGDDVWGGRNPVFPHPDAKVWLERMGEKGWTAPGWPREYGGGGLGPGEVRVLEAEMKRMGCRAPLRSFGVWMLGPVLLQYGTEEQKREHLPKITRG